MRSGGLDRGVAVDYYLKQPAAEGHDGVLDCAGQGDRTFAGAPPTRAQAPAPEDDDGGSAAPPGPHPAVAAGLHRLNVGPALPGATDFPGLIMWAASSRGPIAPPGTYQARVSADGQTRDAVVRRSSASLTFGKDVTDQDLAGGVRSRDEGARQGIARRNEAVLLVRGIREQI